MANNFQIDPLSVCGISHTSYLTSLRESALQKPGEYFKLRNIVHSYLKETSLSSLYLMLFNILTTGKNNQNDAIGGVLGNPPFIVAYPSNKINSIVLEIINNLSADLDRVLEIVVPIDINKLADSNFMLQSKVTQFI